MSEPEILTIINQIRQLPITTREKIEALNKILDEKGITEKEPYIKKLLE